MGELEPDDSRDQQRQRQDGQSQQQSGWRATEEGREAQDNEFAGDIDAAPSLRPEADDGQWSQQPQQEEDESAKADYPLGADRLGAEPRGPRESMRQPGDGERREQAERGGG